MLEVWKEHEMKRGGVFGNQCLGARRVVICEEARACVRDIHNEI